MAFSHVLTKSVGTGGKTISGQKTYSGDSRISIDVSVADEAVDFHVDMTLDVSEIDSIFILSDQSITLETNNAGTPVDTISLVANVPYCWDTDCYFANILDSDITGLYFTNASGAAARVQIDVVYDGTPA